MNVLNGLNSESVDLVYLDPPFNSKRLYNAPIGSRAEGSRFKDTWKWSDVNEYQLDIIANDFPELADYIEIIDRVSDMPMKAYITYMSQRVIQLHRILKPTGSIYYHCDPTAGHFVKLMLDCVFGKENFRNEIVWQRNNAAKGSQHNSKRFGVDTDCIFFYSKSENCFLNANSFDGNLEEKFPKVDEKGRRYNTATPLWRSKSMGDRPNLCYDFHGFHCPYPSGWRLSKERMEEEFNKGNVVIVDDKIERRAYLDDYKGYTLSNLWSDIPRLTGQSKERTGYPTQKPLALLERIIKASCPEGGIVLDPFCGCATTCVAAQRLKRKWIGIDIEDKAVDLLIERLEQDGNLRDTEISQLDLKYKKAGEDFIILNCEKDETKLPHRTDIENKNLDEPKTKAEIKKFLYQKQAHKCNGCGCEFPIDLFDIDHIVPKTCGGGDYIENYQLLCRTCNTTKGARPMAFLLQRIDLIRKLRREVEY